MKTPMVKLTLLFLFVAGSIVQAQDFDEPTDEYGQGDLRYGVKLGTTLNQMNHSGMFIGFAGGGFIAYGATDFLDVQGEILYANQGASRSDAVINFNGVESVLESIRWFNRSVNLHTVQVPITAAFKFPDANAGAIVPKVYLGAAYAYNFGAFELRDEEQVFLDGTRAIILGRMENVGSRFKQHQVDVLGGIGLDIKYADGKVFLFDVRYQMSAMDINNNTFELYQGGTLRKNSLSITFGTTF